jgi:hypothetical protein
MRARYFYKVPEAGKKIGLNRSEAYRAVSRGEIPGERHGKFLLVPKKTWDRRVSRLLRNAPRRKAPSASAAEKKAAENATATTA